MFESNVTGAEVCVALADVREARGGVRGMKDVIAKIPDEKSGRPGWNDGVHELTHPASDDLVDDLEPLLSCWEALDGRIRLILSRDGKLIAGSPGAGGLLAQGGPLVCTNARSIVCSKSSHRQLRQILSAAVGATETIVVPKHTSQGHYVMSATGICAAAVAVAVRDADVEFTTVLADLEEVFGLTRCEVLVIEKLMHGHAAQHIADELDVSVHTVRAHLRHCYDKLEVSSREELWQRLAPYRLN